ncbi:dCTP pyrophosphatase 1 [Pantherophis guttatus]|uniref:dCTP pyrophosphatase 1 n=1 Tax=Pantherophis guttatus TaxID=94885 RepID=A0A6P9C6X3_PANGU|nr:dCTP pyrophosphatase 1 [Pantherophis guttatus]XP_034275645.1 dCTP pyrophosphatase 1 [Pantherophis guttatus]
MASTERDEGKETDSNAQFQATIDEEGRTICQTCKHEMCVNPSDPQQHMASNAHDSTTESSGSQTDEENRVSEDCGLANTIFKKTEASLTACSTKKNEEEVDQAVVTNGPSASPVPFRFSSSPTLEEIRSLQSAFAAERGWGKYHQPRNLLLALVGEVGELAELFQWREEAPEGLPGWTTLEREDLSDELSDVLIYLVALANKCHVDLPTAALRKIEKNRLKYPAKRVYGSSKKYTEYQE